MKRFKRNLSQDDGISCKSGFEGIFIANPKIPSFQEVVAPFAKLKSGHLTIRKKTNNSSYKDFTQERAKVEKFLLSKKKAKNPQFLTMSRDISHLKDKHVNPNLAISQSSFHLLPPSHDTKIAKLYPDIKELSDFGKAECDFLPRCFEKNAENVKKYSKDWLMTKDSKFVCGRQDVQNLKNWFDDVKGKLVLDYAKNNELNQAKGFVVVALKELYSQLAVHSVEQASILVDLFEFHSKVVDRFSRLARSSDKARILNQFENTQNELKAKVFELESKVFDLQQEKINMEKNEEELKERISKLEEELNFQKEFLKNPLRRKTSISINPGNYDLSKFAENLKKKFGELEGYENLTSLIPRPPNIRITSFNSLQPEENDSDMTFSSASSACGTQYS